MIIRPTVMGPLDLAQTVVSSSHDLLQERLVRAHYRSEGKILQECNRRFSKIFLLCFFYCKFKEEEIDCTPISTASPDQALSGGHK